MDKLAIYGINYRIESADTGNRIYIFDFDGNLVYVFKNADELVEHLHL